MIAYPLVSTMHLIIAIMQSESFRHIRTFRIYSVECLSKIMSIIAVIFYAIYEVICLWLTHSSFDYYENICTLSCYHCQIDNIYHATVFRLTSWNNGICCILHCSYRQWRDSNKYIYIYIIKPHEFARLGILVWTIHMKQNMWICCRTYFIMFVYNCSVEFWNALHRMLNHQTARILTSHIGPTSA